MSVIVKIVDSKNTKSFIVAGNNFESLKQKASTKFGLKIERFIRLSDGAELDDQDTFNVLYKKHEKNNPDEEMLLVALEKDDEFSDEDREYFQLAEYSKLSNLIRELRKAESVDVCFLVDCTGSMQTYIDKTKTLVLSVYRKLKSSVFKNLKFRSAFVGYRDYDANGNKCADQIVSLDFSEDTTMFEKFVGGIKASGGGDDCEDVFGGLKKVTELSWSQKTRVMLHICDAPCHGKQYYDTKLTDSHPNGDPKGLKLSNLLNEITELNITYYFTEINEHTKKMIEEFNKEIDFTKKGKKIVTYNLKSADDLLEVFATSITLTICDTQTMSMHKTENKKPKDLKVDKIRLNWAKSNFIERTAEMYEHKFNGNLNTFKELMRQYKTKKGKLGEGIEKVDSYVKAKRIHVDALLCEAPFAKGTLRYAYAALIKDSGASGDYKKYVAKNSLFVEDFEKESSYENTKQIILSQVIAKYLADEFLKLSRAEKTVKFIQVNSMQMETGEYYTVEEFLDGNFSKWSNNIGYINETDYSYLLDAFSHWTYNVTDGYLVVSDLQGFRREDQYVLTDPAISCIHRQFTATDLGELGIKKFEQRHKCNHICKDLGLTDKVEREMTEKATKLKVRK